MAIVAIVSCATFVGTWATVRNMQQINTTDDTEIGGATRPHPATKMSQLQLARSQKLASRVEATGALSKGGIFTEGATKK